MGPLWSRSAVFGFVCRTWSLSKSDKRFHFLRVDSVAQTRFGFYRLRVNVHGSASAYRESTTSRAVTPQALASAARTSSREEVDTRVEPVPTVALKARKLPARVLPPPSTMSRALGGAGAPRFGSVAGTQTEQP